MQGQPQIFQTSSPSRWQRFKWGGRLLFLVLMLAIIVLVVAIKRVYNPTIPQLKEQGEQYKAILHPGKHALMQESRLLRQYQGFRTAINAHQRKSASIKY